jgi:hypothetical protein
MGRYTKLSTLVVTSFIATGCSSMYQPEPDISDLDGSHVVTITGALSQSFVRDGKSSLIICSQPMPDAAFDETEGGSVAMTIPGMGSESGNETEGSNDVEMAGRTPAVLITREMFFRACEFSSNFNLSPEDATKVYLQTLDTVSKGWAAEAGNTTITIGGTLTNNSGITDNLSTTIEAPKSLGGVAPLSKGTPTTTPAGGGSEYGGSNAYSQ